MKFPKAIFAETEKLMQKFKWNVKSQQIGKTIFKKNLEDSQFPAVIKNEVLE